jgi:hypothetical protein
MSVEIKLVEFEEKQKAVFDTTINQYAATFRPQRELTVTGAELFVAGVKVSTKTFAEIVMGPADSLIINWDRHYYKNIVEDIPKEVKAKRRISAMVEKL